MAELVLREDRDGLALLTLNRPDKLNAINQPLCIELRAHLEDIARRTDEVGLVVIRGAGKGFCAGNDIEEMSQRVRQPEPNFKGKTVEMVAQVAAAGNLRGARRVLHRGAGIGAGRRHDRRGRIRPLRRHPREIGTHPDVGDEPAPAPARRRSQGD